MTLQAAPLSHIEWDPALIRKYDHAGPRYTSYPTALEFSESFAPQLFSEALSNAPDTPLSLYVHIPFCHSLCWYCGCNKLVTRSTSRIDRYLTALRREINRRAALCKGRRVTQLHFGGGTPSYLNTAQRRQLMATLRTAFTFDDAAECSIEIDPRRIELTLVDELRQEGFNRLSIGVQDFNADVQQAIHREQDEAFIFALRERARDVGFDSVSIDLIYGLPHQDPAHFDHTLARTLALDPDRISLFSYAHMPSHFPAQRLIQERDLPSADIKLELLQQAIARLTQNGYQFIGMDHFARPDDELAVSQRQGRLHRNFQGYTPSGAPDVLGLGVSAISSIGALYAQNLKSLDAYEAAADEQGETLWRGVVLDHDDELRRTLIHALMCHFEVDITAIETAYAIDFMMYFAEDLALLTPMIEDGLATLDAERITVTARGRLLVRTLCACFDPYLRRRQQQHYSRVI